MNLSQNNSGRAFEYGIAVGFSKHLPAILIDGSEIRKAKECFEIANPSEQKKIVKAAREIVQFIIAHDNRLNDNDCIVLLQADQKGQAGDVRDVIIRNTKMNCEIGISAKNRHHAVKHSRLSEQLDFGFDWMGVHCSDKYFHQVRPIFQELRNRHDRGEHWRDVQDKRGRFYLPILEAFQAEMMLLFSNGNNKVAQELVKYLLGKYDFYKVIKENGNVSISSYNIGNSLKWGSRMPLPTSITNISLKPKSSTTVFMTFDKGWQLSFRIHNASRVVEPSLKFDINIVGLPSQISRHEISYLHA